MPNITKKTSIFQGDISSSLTVAEIFQTLASKEREGWLLLTRESAEISMYFRGKFVGLVSHPTHKLQLLPHKLFYSGKISEEEYQIASKKKNNELIIYLKKIILPDTEKALNTICHDSLCQFMSWKEGYFKFIQKRPEEIATYIGELFSIDGILMESAKRVDEWNEINKELPSWKELLVCNPPEMQEDDSKFASDTFLDVELEKNILNLVQKTSIEEVLKNCIYSEFVTCKTLASLYRQKRIRSMSSEELVGYALRIRICASRRKIDSML